ncbi:TPA: hypothetical protein R4Y39_002218 [Raoultella planticola]|nr:hypothetical protein [Raoultella planticola]
MTITLQAVNELIQSLESAGELSIREQKFLKLAKAYQQLAAENVALKAAFNKPDAWLSCHSIPPTYQEPDRGGEYLAVHQQPGEKNDDGSDSWPVYAKPEIETPATDRIYAGIKADAQSEVIEWLDAEITAIDTMYRGDPSYERDAYWMKSEVLDVVELARKAFPAQLREGAK